MEYMSTGESQKHFLIALIFILQCTTLHGHDLGHVQMSREMNICRFGEICFSKRLERLGDEQIYCANFEKFE